MNIDNMIFQTNNVVGNFNYPPNVPAYKPIMKFLRNHPLYNAFSNCPSVVYQNFLREFWSTAIAFDPFSSTDESDKFLLKEFLIKFLVLNEQIPLTLDFNTFCSSTGLHYNNGKSVDHPTPKLLAYSLITGTEVDIEEINYSDLVTKLLNKSRLKYVSYPIFISIALQVLLGPDYTQDKKFGFLPPVLSNSNFTKDQSKVTEIELTAHMIAVNNQIDSVSPPPLVAKPKKGKSQTVTPPKPTKGSEQSHPVSSGTIPDPQDLERDIQLTSTGLPSTLDEDTRKSKPLPEGTATHPKDSRGDKPTSSIAPHNEASNTDSSSDKILKKYDDTLPLTERQLIKYLRKVSCVLFKRITEDQWEKHEEAVVYYVNFKAFIDDYYNKNIAHNDPAINKKIDEAFKTLAKISTQTIVILSSVRSFDFPALQSTFKHIQDHAFKQEEALAAWMKSSTNMAWNLGQSSLAPSSSVTLTFALTDTPADVEGENATHTATKELPSHIKGETDANIQDKLEELKQSTDANIEFIGSSTHLPSITQAQPIIIIYPEPSILHREGKEEEIKKAEEEVRLNAISKTEIIKVVCEEAKKLGIHPKEAITTKAGELFKKAQEAKHDVLKRQHTKKVRKSLKLIKHKGGRNFDVHKPFLFGAFGISELDKLREIIPKKKNRVVKDLMNSLSRRYERLSQIPIELGIQSALPAP
nr:hypothetical protein [Tanacetum cinerariifolium]